MTTVRSKLAGSRKYVGFTAKTTTTTSTTSTESTAPRSFAAEASISSTTATDAATTPPPTFYVAEDLIGSSTDSDDVIITLAAEESAEIPPISESTSDRFSITPPVIDADRIDSGLVDEAILRGSSTETTRTAREILSETGATSGVAPGIASIILAPPTVQSDDSFSFPDTESGRAASMTRTFVAGGESEIGKSLKTEEKPKIVAALSSNIVSGFPSKNIVFIKKIKSDRAVPTEYKLWRKKIFEDVSFQVIATFTTDSIPIPEKYIRFMQYLPYQANEIFIFEDSSISGNNIYVYKVSVKWEELSEEEIRIRNLRKLGAASIGRNAGFSIL